MSGSERGRPGHFFWKIGRKGAPKGRGPAVLLDFDDTGATVKFQGRAFGISRCRVRKRQGPQGADAPDPGRFLRIAEVADDWMRG